MKVKFILPALTEAKSPFWRPIKYSLFPPLGLATLAGYLDEGDEATLQDEHVETLDLDDEADLVAIQVYVTSAYRAYEIASLRERVRQISTSAVGHGPVRFKADPEAQFPVSPLVFGNNINTQNLSAPYETNRDQFQEEFFCRGVAAATAYCVASTGVGAVIGSD